MTRFSCNLWEPFLQGHQSISADVFQHSMRLVAKSHYAFDSTEQINSTYFQRGAKLALALALSLSFK